MGEKGAITESGSILCDYVKLYKSIKYFGTKPNIHLCTIENIFEEK